MSEPWIVPGDPRREPPAVCPHPGGTREYAEWWEAYFKLKIPLMRESNRSELTHRRACEKARYGHDFYTRDNVCLCGLTATAFSFPGDDEKWLHREKWICPRVRGPIYYLDCYFYGALCGDRFPVNSFGPALWDKIDWLRAKIGKNFDRTEIVTDTKGQGPLEEEYWPGSTRPH